MLGTTAAGGAAATEGGTMTSRRLTLPTVTLALAALLAGCAGSAEPGGGDPMDEPTSPAATEPTSPAATSDAVPSVAETTFPGAPEGVTGEDVTVVAGDDARHVQVVTYGSSTCPVVPTDVAWDADAAVLRVTLSDGEAYDGACTMDLVPSTSVVALPDEAPDAVGLTVDVDGRSIVVG